MTTSTAERATRHASILLVDDHPLTRDGLRLLLASEPGLSVCGEAGTLAEARRLAATLAPDLILLDLRLPDGLGFDLLEEVRAWADPPKVVVISICDEGSPEVVAAFRLGAAGYVGKPTPGEGVLAAVRTALAGRTSLPDGLIRRLLRRHG